MHAQPHLFHDAPGYQIGVEFGVIEGSRGNDGVDFVFVDAGISDGHAAGVQGAFDGAALGIAPGRHFADAHNGQGSF